MLQSIKFLWQNRYNCVTFERKIIFLIEETCMYLLSLMNKPALYILKITSPNNCKFILNLYKTYSLKEIRSERYYIQKIDNLKTCQGEIIWT